MSRTVFFSISVMLILLHFVPGALSWGKEGHYLTCKIAEVCCGEAFLSSRNLFAMRPSNKRQHVFQGFLREESVAAVKKLLPLAADGELASVCSWADEIRHLSLWRWTGPLHYIDTPDFKCNYDYCRDCHDFARRKNRCVAGAIYNYSLQLLAYQNPDLDQKYNYTEALLFLSHFTGDIHQPLHVGFTGDEGGNTVIVHWYRRKTNLHHVWDTMIIESALKKFYNSHLTMMVRGLQTNLLEEWSSDISSWQNCGSNYIACPNLYASESSRLACKFAYKNATPGSTLEDEYFLSRLPLVMKRLAQGGVRLAATLNRIFLPDQHTLPLAVA